MGEADRVCRGREGERKRKSGRTCVGVYVYHTLHKFAFVGTGLVQVNSGCFVFQCVRV